MTFAPFERRSPLGNAAVWEYEGPHHSDPGRSWWRRLSATSGAAAKRWAFENWIVERFWTVRP